MAVGHLNQRDFQFYENEAVLECLRNEFSVTVIAHLLGVLLEMSSGSVSGSH